MTFTESQRRAITAGGAEVCVVAGPGSGKTTVLVERLRRLVVEERVAPEKVVAITFTRKAAMSMRARLAASAGAEAERERLERAHVSTIHAFCAHLLRENAPAADLDPDFVQIDEAEAGARLSRAVFDALDALWREQPAEADLFLRNFRETNRFSEDPDETAIHKQLKELVDSARSRGEDIWCAQLERPEQPAREWITKAAKRSVRLYQEGKAEKGLLDFTDLESRTLALLLKSDEEVRIPYRHVLLDEHQDTNPLQEKLLAALMERCRGNEPTLFAVGDLNQSIYLFRHAEPAVFQEFREHVGATGVVELYDNFRSRPEILRAVERITAGLDGLEARELTARRELPEKEEPSVEVMLVFKREDEEGAPHHMREALWTAKRILELRTSSRLGKERRSPRWRDFAILVRTNRALDLFGEALRIAGAPFEVNAGQSFFEAREVRDALSVLRAMDDPADDIRLAAALRSPFCGVSDETLLRTKERTRPLFEGMRRPPALGTDQRERLARFRETFDELRAERERVSPDVLLSRLLGATGYQAWLLEQPGGRQRSANLDKLGRLAARASAARSFTAMLERLEAMAQEGGGEPEAATPESSDGVQLMTVHAAKGLEFPVVFLPAMAAGARRDSSSLLFHPDDGLGARWKPTLNAKGKEDKNPDEAYQRVHDKRKPRFDREEERLLYVAMTRAEEHLVLSATYSGNPIKRNWAKPLARNLKPPWECAPCPPRVIEREGFSFRFAAYDRDPQFTVEDRATEKVGAPERLKPATPGGQADSEAAVTSVALFADCPRRYYLSRYLGLERQQAGAAVDEEAQEAAPDELEPTELGRRVHEILGGLVEREGQPEEALELAGRFERSELGRRAAAAGEVHRERSLLFPVDGRLLRGQVDLLFADAQGRALIDYKTDRVGERETVERSERYALQLQLYALGLANAGEKPDRGILYFLRPDRAVEVNLSEPALRQARRAAAELFAAQESREFPVAPASRCVRCPHYRGLCPAVLPRKGQLDLGFGQ